MFVKAQSVNEINGNTLLYFVLLLCLQGIFSFTIDVYLFLLKFQCLLEYAFPQTLKEMCQMANTTTHTKN